MTRRADSLRSRVKTDDPRTLAGEREIANDSQSRFSARKSKTDDHLVLGGKLVVAFWYYHLLFGISQESKPST